MSSSSLKSLFQIDFQSDSYGFLLKLHLVVTDLIDHRCDLSIYSTSHFLYWSNVRFCIQVTIFISVFLRLDSSVILALLFLWIRSGFDPFPVSFLWLDLSGLIWIDSLLVSYPEVPSIYFSHMWLLLGVPCHFLSMSPSAVISVVEALCCNQHVLLIIGGVSHLKFWWLSIKGSQWSVA